ncbi:MAG: hypothetical protein ACYSTL_06740 [Planctomycetota bacterium]
MDSTYRWYRRVALCGIVIALAVVSVGAEEPAAQPEARQTAATHQAATQKITTKRAFLDVEALLNGWEASYLPIRSMSVSYREKPVEFDPNALTVKRLKVLEAYPVRAERIESGEKYHLQYWIFSKGPKTEGEFSRFAFDGEITRAYWEEQKQGIVQSGRVNHPLKDINSLKRYMLLNTYKYKGEDPKYSQGIPEFSWIISTNISTASVWPGLDIIAGKSCHVVDVPCGEMQGAGWRLWVAHENGFLLMKFVEYLEATHFEEIEVKELDSMDAAGGKLWYPVRAHRTLTLPKEGAARYELTVEKFVPNIKPDPGAFTFDFPKGTSVTDKVQDREYVVGGEPTTQATQPASTSQPATRPVAPGPETRPAKPAKGK